MLQRTTEADLAQRLDRLPVTWLHALAVGLCSLGFAFDLLEISLGSALSAVFSAPPHAVASQQLSLLLSSVYLGAIVGAPLFGWLADRYGRRAALSGLLLLLALTSFAAAASEGIAQLSVARCLSGLALGAYPPLMVAYLSDLLPPGRRGLLTMVTCALGTVGPALGIFLIRSLTPLQPFGIEAWRWAFIAGAGGALLVGLLFRLFLPESPRWLASRGLSQQAEDAYLRFERSARLMDSPAPAAAPVDADAKAGGHPPAPGGLRGHLLLGGLFFLSPWSTVAFPLLMGAALMQKGFKIADTLLFVGLSTFGPPIGSLLSGAVIDRYGRRGAMLLCLAVMGCAGIGFSLSATPVPVTVAAFLFMLASTIYLPLLSLYSAELFATRTRAASLSTVWALNRCGAALAPLLLLPLLHDSGGVAMASVITASLLASALLLLVAPAGRQRRSLA